MKTYLLYLWDLLRASYWFVPTLFVLAAVAMSFGLPYIDARVASSDRSLPEWVRTTTDTGRSTLSAMAGAMMAVTGTVFSIMIVTLSLTSQQFGPRLLRRFMYDLATQITLGVFLSTSFYCLLTLRIIEKHDKSGEIPHLTILAAIPLLMLSMSLLIFFIHHVAMMIQAPHVVASVAQDLNDSVDRLFPEKLGNPAEQAEERRGREQAAWLGDSCLVIRSDQTGYIQALDLNGLLSMACDHNLVIRLRAKPGDFIAARSPLADVWPSGEQHVEQLPEEDLATELNQCVIAGIRRTPRQDVECAMDELVEVAVRALSPGINDPFTAINCIDHLSAVLGRLAGRSLPVGHRCDDDGHLRVIVEPVSFPEVLDTAFNQIRQNGRDSVAVTIRLLEALELIAEHVRRDEDRAALLLHAKMTQRLSQSFAEDYDKQAVAERFNRVQRLLHAGAQELSATDP